MCDFEQGNEFVYFIKYISKSRPKMIPWDHLVTNNGTLKPW